MKTQTQEEAIAKIEAKHGKGTFDFSKFVYTKSNKPATLICKVHGAFQQKPCDTAYGSGCPACGHATRSKTPKTVKPAKSAKVAPTPKEVPTKKAGFTPEQEAAIAHFQETTGCNRGAAIKRMKRAAAKK